MIRSAILSLILVSPAFGQTTTTITINDSNGNQTNGTINGSNVFFHDSKGNIAFGTIKDGNVYLTTSGGEVLFGTVKSGNVFLTDQNGNTTGTIRNGDIFLSNSDGSITTGTYDSNHTFTTTTPAATTPADTTPAPSQVQQPSTQYQDGYAIGQQLGTALGSAIQIHRIKSACKKHADDSWRFPDGSFVTCSSVNAGHPVRQWPAQAALSSPAADPNGEKQGRQAHDLMERLRSNINSIIAMSKDSPPSPKDESILTDARNSWRQMRDLYCKESPIGSYYDLQNQLQTCLGN
ncbi:MAG TPA: hypothetical protein VGT08_09725 [Terracidiphilus sp.]|nr:hypothetical protein [Terracidiphilus sp.]